MKLKEKIQYKINWYLKELKDKFKKRPKQMYNTDALDGNDYSEQQCKYFFEKLL